MEFLTATSGLHVLSSFMGVLASVLVGALEHLAGTDLFSESALGLFRISECTPDSCPGSAYNLVTAAWANIGYMTHSDFLHLVNDTGFSAWAPLFYVMGAIGGLIGIALNSPPKNYTWLMIGPGIFSFLIGTTTDVSGVAWRVAGQYQPMEEVWKDAETGIGNTYLVKRLGLSVNKKDGPSGQYPVAWTLVFLDGLFSSTTNRIVSWIGIGTQEGSGGSDSNLAKKEGDGVGPWYILANLKWGMLENIVGVNARDPDVRDALITFLASECGDQFKKGVDTGAYSAASQSRGSSLPTAVLKDGSTSSGSPKSFTGASLEFGTYKKFIHGLDTEVIPTPRSIVRLFNQPKAAQGSFRLFTEKWRDNDNADTSGRTVEIVCSEYLWVVLQALRWESGHAYWQLVRSSPNGFTRTALLKSLFYGWDIRQTATAQWASDQELESFVKQLIFLHMLKNELLFAPQITETGQRFAPSEQTRGFTEAYVRDQGSRAKAGELYNWAIMMPHVQGILTYLVYIAYPFSVMLMVIPGHWKAFFTWITFLAWVKTWDIGFAIVHTLERSVWAMIGNHSSMARVANMLIQTADKVGTVKVGTASDCQGDKLPELCAIPDVTESQILTQPNAWALLDKSLLLMGSADLDLSTGYYIYIMSALYFAVPAVTGQLVLGAKAGLGSIATQGLTGGANEAGNAAKSGRVGEVTNNISTNDKSQDAGARTKSQRRSGLALSQLETANAAMDADMAGSRIGGVGAGLDSAARGAELRGQSFDSRSGVIKPFANVGKEMLPGSAGTGGSTGDPAGGPTGGLLSKGAAVFTAGMASAQDTLNHNKIGGQVRAGSYGADATWGKMQAGLMSSGFKDYAGKLGAENEFNAASDAWDSKNAFATQVSGMAGVYGYNAGSLAPGAKPTDALGLALSGNLGSSAAQAARYSGGAFLGNASNMTRSGQASFGSSLFQSNWSGGFNRSDVPGQVKEALKNDAGAAYEYAKDIFTDIPE
jgi:hypothetical protein